ncbi:MAG: tRNA 4-thiouridine(8) synthase ThiI [Thermodesulfobacteriota bacterium]
MKVNAKPGRGLGLCSGGLDSILSGLLLRRQGIEVVWIAFETPFFSTLKARNASQMTGIPLIEKEITRDYLPMLKNPPCGYGKQMNPCLDCHALMFSIAGRVMQEEGFDFLFSGEVLGQRPMSQTRPSLRYVEKHSGFDGYILRPLSGKKLPETIPEIKGIITRESLLDITGRSRKRQMKLAEEFGIKEYPAPAGGCLLTDKGYSARLKDLFFHKPNFEIRELHLLKFGRHFRLDGETKIIVGRSQKDNEAMVGYYDPKNDVCIKTTRTPGPVVLIPDGEKEETVRLAASLCAGYAKRSVEHEVEVLAATPSGEKSFLVERSRVEDLKEFRI